MWKLFKISLPVIFSSSLLCLTPVVFAADQDCRITFPEQWSLAFIESGIVDKVNVKAGDRVIKGSTLLTLDTRAFQAGIESANARVSGAQMQLAEARREWNRSRELYDRTLLSDHEKQLVENDMISASSEMHAADSALIQANLAYEYSVLKAPADGLIVNVSVFPGSTVNSRYVSTPVVQIINDKLIAANCLVNEKSIENFKVGQSVQIAIGGNWFTGDVSFISPIGVEEKDGLYVPMQVTLTTQPDIVFSGMKSVVRIKK